MDRAQRGARRGQDAPSLAGIVIRPGPAWAGDHSQRRTGDPPRLAASLIVLAGSYAALRSRRVQTFDRRAGLRIARPLGPVADRVIGAGTDLGSVYAIAGITAGLAATNRRTAALDVAGAGALAWIGAQMVKPLVRRPRPYQAMELVRLVSEPSGASWPSGHVAVAWGMAGALDAYLSPVGRVGAAGLGGLVALSRIYVGVHYVSDVVAGAAIGVTCGVTWRAMRRRLAALAGRTTEEVEPTEGVAGSASEM